MLRYSSLKRLKKDCMWLQRLRKRSSGFSWHLTVPLQLGIQAFHLIKTAMWRLITALSLQNDQAFNVFTELKKRFDVLTVQFLTLCFVIAPTMSGQTMPDNVPTPLEMPMRILAYRGAISRWLTLNPEYTHTYYQHEEDFVELNKVLWNVLKYKEMWLIAKTITHNYPGKYVLSCTKKSLDAIIPDIANPLKPTAKTRKDMAIPLVWENPTTNRKVASSPKPREQRANKRGVLREGFEFVPSMMAVIGSFKATSNHILQCVALFGSILNGRYVHFIHIIAEQFWHWSANAKIYQK